MAVSLHVISGPHALRPLSAMGIRCRHFSPRQVSRAGSIALLKFSGTMGFNDVSRFSAPAAYSTAAARQQELSAIVVGGGAAGIAVLGSLLEGIGHGKIAWVDTEFKGGRINRNWREVPSNTKVGLFLAYAQATKPFVEVLANTPKPNAITSLEELPQDGTCSLSYAGDMLQMLSDGLVKHPRVERHEGKVSGASWNEGVSKSPESFYRAHVLTKVLSERGVVTKH